VSCPFARAEGARVLILASLYSGDIIVPDQIIDRTKVGYLNFCKASGGPRAACKADLWRLSTFRNPRRSFVFDQGEANPLCLTGNPPLDLF